MTDRIGAWVKLYGMVPGAEGITLTVVQQPIDKKKFGARFDTLIAEQYPTGQASRAFDEIKKDVRAISGEHKAELK